MKIDRVTIALTLTAAVLAMAGGFATAQSAGLVSAALAEGRVGEQADGYMGFRAPPSGDLRDEVDAINIKRRAAYTQLAAQRGVTVKDVAATVGCETLASRVAQGRAYQLPDGVWRVKGTTPIQLPVYCVSN
ncbi:MAG: YdbL family protein [Sphingomonadales bacterium]|jgi:uncharacterized protein YdbL (DUF1318 family)|nr:YdbL family protein [Sphingomonadales bacterium]